MGQVPDRPVPSETPAPATPRVTSTSAAPTSATPPVTGDRTVDDALATFERALDGPPGAQVDAATEAHRTLQARLTTPAPAAPPPGEARPGPRR